MSIPTYDWISYHATTRGASIAMEDLATGRCFTYAEFNDRVGRLASAMRARFGVARGDRVAVLAHIRRTCASCNLPAPGWARCSLH